MNAMYNLKKLGESHTSYTLCDGFLMCMNALLYFLMYNCEHVIEIFSIS